MRRVRLLILLVLAGGPVLAARPVGAASAASIDDVLLKLQPLPATFSGTLPCADCPGIRYSLNLYPDFVYQLREEYIGTEPPKSNHDLGRWSISSDGPRLVLRGKTSRQLGFLLKDPGRLRKLDIGGREIESILNYDLAREPQFVAVEPRLAIRGMYRFTADAALLRECVTGRRYAVPARDDHLALAQAYLQARREPGDELLVNAEVRIVRQPRLDGAGDEDAMVIERFTGIWPGETCGTPTVDASLCNTYWRLVRLGQEPVAVSSKRREPHLRFLASADRVLGHTGCNRLAGSYDQTGATLRLDALTTSRRTCEDDAGQEQALIEALEATRRFSIAGSHLELLAEDGRLLARFEATYF